MIVRCPSCGHEFGVANNVTTDSPDTLVRKPSTVPAVFAREGEYWFIAYDRDGFRLKDTKGLRYLATLLSQPGREFLALHLAAGSEGDVEPSVAVKRFASETGLRLFVPQDSGELLDSKARGAYENRLRDLREELDEADRFADSGRSASLKEEIDFLTHELAAATGLGGSRRRTPSPAERARQSVTKAIRSAAIRISRQSPSLGRHLASTVRTGTYCVYDPDPRVPIVWRL